MKLYNVSASVVGLIEASSEAEAIAKLTRAIESVDLEIHVDPSAGWNGPDAFESEQL